MKEYKNINDLHNLDMHERMFIRRGFYVTRVPGGWLYETTTRTSSSMSNPVGKSEDLSVSTTFVPYTDDRESESFVDENNPPFYGGLQ